MSPPCPGDADRLGSCPGSRDSRCAFPGAGPPRARVCGRRARSVTSSPDGGSLAPRRGLSVSNPALRCVGAPSRAVAAFLPPTSPFPHAAPPSPELTHRPWLPFRAGTFPSRRESRALLVPAGTALLFRPPPLPSRQSCGQRSAAGAEPGRAGSCAARGECSSDSGLGAAPAAQLSERRAPRVRIHPAARAAGDRWPSGNRGGAGRRPPQLPRQLRRGDRRSRSPPGLGLRSPATHPLPLQRPPAPPSRPLPALPAPLRPLPRGTPSARAPAALLSPAAPGAAPTWLFLQRSAHMLVPSPPRMSTW